MLWKENMNLVNSVDDFLRFGYSKSFKFINLAINETNWLFLVKINEKQIAISNFIFILSLLNIDVESSMTEILDAFK